MTLLDLRNLLLTITPNVYHYKACEVKEQYIVWAEDGEAGSVNANDEKEDQVIQGTIDYFTKTEFDPNFELIQDKLNSANLSWRLNSIQYEEETSFIHYEWTWEMI